MATPLIVLFRLFTLVSMWFPFGWGRMTYGHSPTTTLWKHCGFFVTKWSNNKSKSHKNYWKLINRATRWKPLVRIALETRASWFRKIQRPTSFPFTPPFTKAFFSGISYPAWILLKCFLKLILRKRRKGLFWSRPVGVYSELFSGVGFMGGKEDGELWFLFLFFRVTTGPPGFDTFQSVTDAAFQQRSSAYFSDVMQSLF